MFLFLLFLQHNCKGVQNYKIAKKARSEEPALARVCHSETYGMDGTPVETIINYKRKVKGNVQQNLCYIHFCQILQNTLLTNLFPIPIPQKRIGSNYFCSVLIYFKNEKEKLFDNLPNIFDALKKREMKLRVNLFCQQQCCCTSNDKGQGDLHLSKYFC